MDAERLAIKSSMSCCLKRSGSVLLPMDIEKLKDTAGTVASVAACWLPVCSSMQLLSDTEPVRKVVLFTQGVHCCWSPRSSL